MSEIRKRFLAPVEGGRVRKPDGTILPEAGDWVVSETYWDRLLMHGDIEEREPPAEVADQAPAPVADDTSKGKTPRIAQGDAQ
jgi:hypothetical protein